MLVDLPDSLLKRIQKQATPYVDTYVSVIERWGDFFDKHQGLALSPSIASAESSSNGERLRQFDPETPPNLLYTTVRGEFGLHHFSNWNELLRIAHLEAFAKAQSFAALRRVTRAQIVEGGRTDSGYHFLPEIGISLQNVDAGHAWQYAFRLAKYLGFPLKAYVEWRHNEKAAFPGLRGVLSWLPSSDGK